MPEFFDVSENDGQLSFIGLGHDIEEPSLVSAIHLATAGHCVEMVATHGCVCLGVSVAGRALDWGEGLAAGLVVEERTNTAPFRGDVDGGEP